MLRCTKKVNREIFTLISLSLIFFILLQPNVLQVFAASKPEPMSALYVDGTIISYGEEDEDERSTQKETVKNVTYSDKSLWYNDVAAPTRQVIATYDNKGATRHYRNNIKIYVMQEGEGGTYELINGKSPYTPVSMTTNVISSYPYPFIAKHEYVFSADSIDLDAPYTIFTVGRVQSTESGNPYSYERFETNVYIYWEDDRNPAPNVRFALDPAVGEMTLLGADSTMEYRLKNAGSASWKPCTDAPMYFDQQAAEQVYYVRYAANGSKRESQTREIVLSAKRSAPTAVSYSTDSEILSGLTTQMEVQINDAAYTGATSSTMDFSERINAIPQDTTETIRVRYKATGTEAPSYARTFTLHPRGETPTTLQFDPVTLRLSGYSGSLQYKGDGDTAWRYLSGTTFSLENYARSDRDATVLVRTPPKSNASASLPATITIKQLPPAPVGHMDYTNEAVVNLPNGAYQYKMDNSTSWSAVNITDGTWNIQKLISSTSARTAYLRKAATDTAPASAAAIFEVPIRAAAPSTPVFVYNDPAYPDRAVLSGVTTAMEYKKSTDTEWTSVTKNSGVVFDLPSASATYYIRSKTTEQAFASLNKTLTLYKAGTAPSCAYNSTTEMITSLTTKMEMKIDNGAYTPVTATSFSTTEVIDGIPYSGGSKTIRIRTQATATAPASVEKVFTLYARSTAPSALNYNTGSNAVTGCTTAMQYRIDSSSTWYNISGSTLNLQSYANEESDVKVFIRMKPTATTSASLPVEFTIPKMLPGPTGTVDYINECVSGLSGGEYQYSTNKSSWSKASVTNGKWDISTLIGTSSRTLYLRKAATSTTPVTSYTAFTIAARTSAPSTPSFVYNHSSYSNKAVLSGVTSAMQYRKSTDTSWTNVTGGSDIVLDIPTASVTYYVRNKATTQAFASQNKTLTLYKAGTAPGCAYNSTTEMITSLTTKMEMKIDNGAYTPVTATSLSMSDTIDKIGGVITVYVRTQATSSSPASTPKQFNLYARNSKPSTLSYNYSTNMITGCSNAMQYRLDSATGWTSISGTTLNTTSFARTDRDVKIYIRMKPTATSSASQAVEFTIPIKTTSSQGNVEEPGTMLDITENVDAIPPYDYSEEVESDTNRPESDSELSDETEELTNDNSSSEQVPDSSEMADDRDNDQSGQPADVVDNSVTEEAADDTISDEMPKNISDSSTEEVLN